MSIGQIEKNKLILFGTGSDFENFVWDSNRENILAVTDLNSELYHKPIVVKNSLGEIIFNGEISSVDEICNMDFDYIITTDIYSIEQTHKILNEKGIRDDFIVMYDYYVQCIRAHTFYSVLEEANILKLFEALNIKNVIDMDLFFADKYRYSREYAELTFSDALQVDAYSPNDELRPIYNNVYRKIFKNFKEFYLKNYDAAIFSDYRSFEDYLKIFDLMKDIADHIILRFRKNSSDFKKFSELNFSKWGEVRILNLPKSSFFVISKHHSNDMKIYICCHKPCMLPREINGSNIYQPIQSGRKLNPPFACIGDDTGENISELQPYINELVVLYWIWKNTSHEYVGLCHYRRYFLSRPLNRNDIEIPILNEEQAKDILKDYDIITRFKYYERQDSIIRNQFFWITGTDIFKKSEITIRKWLKIRQPDYLPILDYVLGNTGFFTSNMFVTRKKVIDKYCEWLFSFLIDAVRDFDVKNLPNDQVRIFSYWGEIMLTVWLMNQNLKIKQLFWHMTPKEMWELPENKN